MNQPLPVRQVLITGAYGMLGSDLALYLTSKGYQVTAPTSEEFNLLDADETLTRKLAAYAPEIVFHCAAFTQVDRAEVEPDLVMAVNKDGVRKLASACREIDATLVYISTDFVFDGLKQAPYEPDDRPNPINTYGLSKYYGELMVSELMEKYYVVRVSWIYGVHRPNFVQWVVDAATAGRTIQVVTDWKGSPTWTGTICAALEGLVQTRRYGVYHIADQGNLSRYEQALIICKRFGLPDTHIVPVESTQLNLPANRPIQSALSSPGFVLPTWETGLEGYYHQAQAQC